MYSTTDTSTSVDTNNNWKARENEENQYVDIRSAALELADQGIPVFPCWPGTKTPATKNGLYDATVDPKRIRGMFTRDDYLISVPTGAASGYTVLDVDPRNGGDESGLDLPETKVVETPSGGRHFYFKNAGIRNSAGKIAPGIDVRGEGGYVVIPPSQGYRWINNAEVAEFPERLKNRVSPKLTDTSFDTEAALEGFSEGERNSGIASLAGKLRGANVPEDVAAELVLTSARNCEPPLDEDEALAVLESIYRYPTNEASPLSPSLKGNGQYGHQEGFIRMSEQIPTNKPREFIIEGLVPKRYATILYGDGGVAKSLNLVHQLMCIARGDNWLGRSVIQADVAYLDFELDNQEQTDRVHAVAKGMEVEVPENFWYMSAAAMDTRRAFQVALNFCVKNGIGVLGIDSVGMALVGNSETSADAIRFFKEFVDPFRAQGITLILVDHQSKMQAGERYQNKTIFGSAYKSHSVRSSIQIEVRERIDDVLKLTFRHQKTNFAKQQDPVGVKVIFKRFDETIFDPDDLTNAELAEESTVNAKDRILKALEDGPMYPADIAEATSLAHKTVKTKLTDLRKAGKVENTGNQMGQSMEVSLVSTSYKGQLQHGHPDWGDRVRQAIERIEATGCYVSPEDVQADLRQRFKDVPKLPEIEELIGQIKAPYGYCICGEPAEYGSDECYYCEEVA